MDVELSDPTIGTSTSSLTAQTASLQRLDDKLATGMTITDVAKARWLTALEVLTFLDGAFASNYADYPLMTSPPSTPPTTGTLLLYNSLETPDYANDGIEWINDPGVRWKSIDRVLAKWGERSSDQSSSDSATGGGAASASGSRTDASSSHGSNILGNLQVDMTLDKDAKQRGSSSGSSSALATGASAEYLSCATRATFHRREYRGPNNIVLLHYLDSVKALRLTSELVDRIVYLSAGDYKASELPSVASGVVDATGTKLPDRVELAKSDVGLGPLANTEQDLGDTMNILMEMVEEHDASGTTVAEAAEEHLLKEATTAAYSAIMKHVAPEEAAGVVGAMELAMEENALVNQADDILSGTDDEITPGDGIVDLAQLTEGDIDEAIGQVLHSESEIMDAEGGNAGGSTAGSGSRSQSSGKGTAQIIEDRILNSMEEVLPEELKMKLISTTEVMLDAAGVSLKSAKGKKADSGKAPMPPQAAIGSPYAHPETQVGAPGSSPEVVGHALPEIVDVTPDFHVNGYQPLDVSGKKQSKKRAQRMGVVISTASPIPGLPPYVDQYYVWERFAAFVDFQEVADDPQVRNVSFNRITPINPYSYKVKMPTDIPNYSVRHIVVVGVLLPKDHRVKRNLRGIELALKLTLQTEWSAAADLVGAYAYTQAQKKAGDLSGTETTPLVKGIRRPIFIAPCGGTRMQLLTQISKVRFTMYPASSLPLSLSAVMSSKAAPNFVQRVAMETNEAQNFRTGGEVAVDAKRKRENYFEEWASTPGIDATMTTNEVDRNRKVRFVERISNILTDSKGESDVLLNSNLSVGREKETKLDGKSVEDMPDEEVDDLLGRVLMRYITVCIDRCSTKEELLGEINWSGYAGLSMLHHACFYNFMALITLLLENGADSNILSAEGDLIPLHFAAEAGHKDVVDVLIRNGSNPIAMDSNGETPADHARKAGHVEVAALLGAYNEQAGIVARENSDELMDSSTNPYLKTSDVFLQSAFKELSLKDKLGLNLFVDRSKAAPMAFIRNPSTSMMTDGDGEGLEQAAFSFITQDDRAKLREAMSLASEMDLKEMNLKAEHQDVRQYLRQSNFEAINAASQALEKSKRKEANALKSASANSDDPSKMQLSRALAMLVLRKNLPTDK